MQEMHHRDSENQEQYLITQFFGVKKYSWYFTNLKYDKDTPSSFVLWRHPYIWNVCQVQFSGQIGRQCLTDIWNVRQSIPKKALDDV